jgi:hypothetical protein
MDSQLASLFFLAAGLVAAPFANLASARRAQRLAATVLLIATLGVLGFLANTFDRGTLPPLSSIFLAGFALVGVSICVAVFRQHRVEFAFFLGAAFLIVVLSVHFLCGDLVRACQRSCAAVQKGMTVEQAHSVVMRQFGHVANYQIIESSNKVRPETVGFLTFDLRPQFKGLPAEYIQVEFSNGLATNVRASAVALPISPFCEFEVIAGFALYAICFRLLGRKIASARPLPGDDVMGALIRAARRAPLEREAHHGSAFLGKRFLMHLAGLRIRHLAFFNASAAVKDMGSDRGAPRSDQSNLTVTS